MGSDKIQQKTVPQPFFLPVAGGDGSRVQGTTAPSMADRPVEAVRQTRSP